MNQLYTTIGMSKQAAHQNGKRQELLNHKMNHLVVEAYEIRRAHPGCGVEKMYHVLKPDFIGGDRFVETFMGLDYRLKRKKNYRRSTSSTNLYYPNLIKGLKVSSPNLVRQSDIITYINIGERFYYAVFIVDVYTKKIVGYHVSDNLRASANVKALKMVLQNYCLPQIHHSGRGSQYIYKEYLNLLNSCNCKISMGLTAQDNAYAERINRTIKEEYIRYWKPQNYTQLKIYLKRAVKNYNYKRPHYHLDKKNPEEFIQDWMELKEIHRPILTIFNN